MATSHYKNGSIVIDQDWSKIGNDICILMMCLTKNFSVLITLNVILRLEP